jgi:hypothetical protein
MMPTTRTVQPENAPIIDTQNPDVPVDFALTEAAIAVLDAVVSDCLSAHDTALREVQYFERRRADGEPAAVLMCDACGRVVAWLD